MNKITPFLWFNTQAEEAANFYTSIFPNSRIVSIMRCGDAGPGPKGSVLFVTFELDGQAHIALNGGPAYTFTPAISLFVYCQTQQEIDHFWSRLTDGGKPIQCGWLVDRFGVSWQIVPADLLEMHLAKDPAKAKRVMQAMMQMVKLDIAALRKAYEGP